MMASLTVDVLAVAIAVVFAAGCLLLFALTFLPPSRAAARQLWPVLGSEAVILAGGVLPWLLPRSLLLVMIVLAAGRVAYESGSVHSRIVGRPVAAGFCLVMIAACTLSWFATTGVLVAGVASLAVVAALVRARSQEKAIWHSLGQFTVFPLLPFVGFTHAASAPPLGPWLVLALLLVEVFDSFSLLGGRLYGRRPLVPWLSPRKTWEGFATGTAALAALLAALSLWFGLPPADLLTIGGVTIVAAPAGDLLGSLAKRRASVKDYPTVMKQQGGVLDIIDSWIVAGPCLAALAVASGWAG